MAGPIEFELPPRPDGADQPPRYASSDQRPPNRWLFIAAIVFFTFLILRYLERMYRPVNDPDAKPRAVMARGDLAADEKTTIELFERASPGVVYITTSTLRRNSFSFNVMEIPRGTGTGFVWDKDGHVVTNFHVLQGADKARVTLADHTSWAATLVGVAPDKDLAVVKIDAEAKRLHPVPIGTSSDLRVGQKVFAIGNPFGLDQTLTTGVISGLNREIKSATDHPIQGVIQTDAAINPGNSGGPLLDSAGRIIGVNTAIYSPSGAYAGIGFAVPVDSVNRVAPQLIRYGKITRPGFGITIAGDRFFATRGLKGVLVLQVMPNSAAARAGIRPTTQDQYGRIVLGDIIVQVDGRAIANQEDLHRALDGKNVGDTVEVVVRRGNERVKLDVVLQALK